MHHSIDIKSVLIGILSTALVLCAIGAVPIVFQEDHGRFQIATNDGYAFVLDSATGQVWSSAFVSPASGIIVAPDPSFHVIKTDHDYYGDEDLP